MQWYRFSSNVRDNTYCHVYSQVLSGLFQPHSFFKSSYTPPSLEHLWDSLFSSIILRSSLPPSHLFSLSLPLLNLPPSNPLHPVPLPTLCSTLPPKTLSTPSILPLLLQTPLPHLTYKTLLHFLTLTPPPTP